MRVVVTGATGNVGTAVVRALAKDPLVDEVVGIARRLPTGVQPAGVRHVALDVVDDPLDVIAGADAVVHLAWKIQPQHDHGEMSATNVTGTQRVLEAVRAHRVATLVCASSVGAYAKGPNDAPVDETWPASGIPSSVYSRHKAAVEAMLDEADAPSPAGAPRIVRMRTSLVFQRRAASEIGRLFVGPWLPRRLPGPLRFVPGLRRLALQATHADDVAEAYRLAVHSTERGAFNIAADGVLTSARIAELVGGRVVPTPEAVVRGVLRLGFAARLQRSEAGWLDMGLDTPLMDTGRARRQLGWRPTRTAEDALCELLAGLGERAGDLTVPLHPGCGGVVSGS